MFICIECGKPYEPTNRGPKPKYIGLCPKCRKKKHTQVHIQKNKDAYLQKFRFYHKKYTYGVDETEFERLYEAQGGRCLICDKPFPVLAERTRSIAVDHDHETGVVRGLLCTQCNVAVAMVREDVTIAASLVSYLQKHKHQMD